MVLNLDKCIGCHTCSIPCKNVWTNRDGAEYMWFNNVECKPGIGYPKKWENQDVYRGGWELHRDRLQLKAGGRLHKGLNIFHNPDLPVIDDYYEPWNYDYARLIDSPKRKHQPSVRPHSRLTGEPIKLKWGPNWEDDLAGLGETGAGDANFKNLEISTYLQFRNVFMFWLPRLCEHCLNPACVASCPSGALYKRDEDGIVLVDQERCRGWRYCVSGCPYKKVYFNWKTGRAEKCIFCYPRIEAGLTTLCAHSCVGPYPLRGGFALRCGSHRRGSGRTVRPGRLPGPPGDPARSQRSRDRTRRRGPGDRTEYAGGRQAIADLCADQRMATGPAAAPRIPDPAHGVVCAAVESGQQPGRAFPGIGDHRPPAHSHDLLGQPAHRR